MRGVHFYCSYHHYQRDGIYRVAPAPPPPLSLPAHHAVWRRAPSTWEKLQESGVDKPLQRHGFQIGESVLITAQRQPVGAAPRRVLGHAHEVGQARMGTLHESRTHTCMHQLQRYALLAIKLPTVLCALYFVLKGSPGDMHRGGCVERLLKNNRFSSVLAPS